MTALGAPLGGLLGSALSKAEQFLDTPQGQVTLGAVATGAGALGAVAVARHRKKAKKRAAKKKAKASRKARTTSRKRPATKKHKPRARGGVHNGHRVLIAKNGTRYIKLKSGKVRFIK